MRGYALAAIAVEQLPEGRRGRDERVRRLVPDSPQRSGLKNVSTLTESPIPGAFASPVRRSKAAELGGERPRNGASVTLPRRAFMRVYLPRFPASRQL
jgi:hypothetical protein